MKNKRLIIDVVDVQETPTPPAEGETESADWKKHARLAPDLSNALWYGTIHHFTPQQGRAVAELWKAWRAGQPDLHQSTVLRAAGSRYAKLCELFRGHTSWGVMIHPSKDFGGRVGCYRLSPPRS